MYGEEELGQVEDRGKERYGRGRERNTGVSGAGQGRAGEKRHDYEAGNVREDRGMSGGEGNFGCIVTVQRAAV